MKTKTVFSVIVIACALAATHVCAYQQQRPAIGMEIARADGGPTSQAMVTEGTTAMIRGLEGFGFSPVLKTKDDSKVVIKILDVTKSPPTLLGEVEASVSGEVATSKTKPAFKVRILRVVRPK